MHFCELGWAGGGMPFELVRSDIARHLLVQIAAEDTPSGGFALAMSAVYRSHAPPGPAGRWFIDCLKGHAKASPLRRSWNSRGTPKGRRKKR